MSLLDEFNSLSLETIQEFVSVGREEDLHLDFKLVSNPELSTDDRKSLAKAPSGFANSDGGIIIWGVDARRNSSGVDCAIGLREIANAALFNTRLNTLTGQSVSPLVDGVHHRAIFRDGVAGFCACLVPASDSGPHMAKGGEDRYFKRSGSAFYRMEHFDLEDMFGRRQRPILSIRFRLVPRAGNDQHEELHFAILNSGRGVAKHAGFFCKFEEAGATVAGVGGHLNDVSSLNQGNPAVTFQDSVGVVHPNGIAASAGHAIIQRAVMGLPLNVAISIYCEGMQVRKANVLVPASGVVISA